MSSPDIAVVTNIRAAHLTGLKNIHTIKKEKLSIAKGLKPNGILITNPASKIKPKNVTCNDFETHFTLEDTKITVPLPGYGNIENAISAWAVCKECNIKIDDFAKALITLPKIPMRLEVLKTNSLTIINDCYNANPASMKNALDILADTTKSNRKVFICGDMAELGDKTEELHKELGTSILQADVNLLITIGKHAKIIADAAKSSANVNLQIQSFDDTVSACNNLHKLTKVNDIILVKGSRVAKFELIVEKLKQLFN